MSPDELKMDRQALIETFLDKSGWRGAKRWRLAGDASFRKYDRVEKDGRRAVLMDAPPPQEDVRPFVSIARHLHARGFSVPEVLAEDAAAGLLLLEDLGDDTYTRLLNAGGDEPALYGAAIDALIALHQRPEADVVPPGVIPYGKERLLEEAGRIHSWYLRLVGAPALPAAAVAEFEDIWNALLPVAWRVPTSLILFDYHIDNLMKVPGRTGMQACGILDFQDAITGPVTYDLMSLLEDARRDVPAAVQNLMKQRYLAAFPATDRAAYEQSWAVMAAQRHLRVIGTFARLKLRDNKPDYLRHMPRLWRYMDRCLAEPLLHPLRDWIDRHVPPHLRVVPA
ncbi:MAG: phosphotransferase [Rhodospirillaceae bacterium]|nr:phosphotransferase [Rhodospirillaceae bacterium]